MIAFLAPFFAGRAVPWALAGALFLALGVQAIALSSARTEIAEAHTAHEKALRVQAELYASQVELAKSDYMEKVLAAQAIADTLTKELDDARTNEGKLATDLRSGAVRVRRALCPAILPSTGSATPAGVDGRRAPDGADIVAAAVRTGREADARLKACIAIAKSDRR